MLRNLPRWFCLVLLLLLVVTPRTGLAAEPLRTFDLPADPAEKTLKLFSEQSGRGLIMGADAVGATRTNAVSGKLTAPDALARMLAGTGFVATQDEKSGAFVVHAENPRPKADRAAPAAPSDRPKTNPAPEPVELVQLSPFVVSEDDSVGYAANSTLAGTRLNTALRDVGASISIITSEFLVDTASTNLGELLTLTTGTEVGGVLGNFAGGAEAFGRPDQSEARENPEGNQRIRGIGPASPTRDFFHSDIPMDAYNTARVTINRGPNSLLFGIGNPAGTIDTSLRKAQLGRDRNEVTARYGSNASYRSSLDLNRVLVKDRLAFRLATVGEQNNFDQEPAFDRKRRIYGTVEAVLRDGKKSTIFGKTSLRVAGETGDSQSTPVNVIPPTNAYSIFFQPPDPALDRIPGVDLNPTVLAGSPGYIWSPRVTVDNRGNSAGLPQNNGAYYFVPWFIHIPLVFDTPGQREPGYLNGNNPALSGIAGVMGRIRYAANPNNRPAIDAISTTSSYNLIPGFTTPVLQNRAVFDYRSRLISGATNRIEQNFTALNAAVTQELFGGRGGLELAVDKQTTRSNRALPFSQGQNGSANGLSDIYIDVSRYLSNDQPNPDLGRPFMQQLGIQDRNTRRYAPNPNNRQAIDTFYSGSVVPTGFVAATLQNTAIFDYRIRLLTGGLNHIDQVFQVGNLAFTQELVGGRGGIEVAYDQQRTRSTRLLPFSFGDNGGGTPGGGIAIDVAQYLSNDQPNPNAGRPFVSQQGITDRTQTGLREAFRATAFYKLDLEDRGRKLFGVPLGNHIFTGLHTQNRNDASTFNYATGWTSPTRNLNTDVFQSTIGGNFRTTPVVVQYLGPSAVNANSLNDVRITNVVDARVPQTGDTYNVSFFDFTGKRLVTEPLSVLRFLNGNSKSRQLIQSQSFSLKSDFFKNNIVSVVGWRWDHLKTFSSVGNTRNPDDTLNNAALRLSATPNLDERGRNFTWSTVGRLPRFLTKRLPLGIELGGFYNASGNFNPVNIRTNLSGSIVPAPAGTTREYGVLVEFFDRRVSLRVNQFHTVQTNSSNNAQGATGGIYNFPDFIASRYVTAQAQGIAFNTIPGVTAAGYNSYAQLYDALFQLHPEPTRTIKNLRLNAAGTALQSSAIAGLTDTGDLDARGLEAELVGNVTRRWRVSFNVAKQETVVSGSAKLTKQVADAV